MSSIYEEHKDEDGYVAPRPRTSCGRSRFHRLTHVALRFLYITYSGENTFGDFETV